MAGYIRQSTFVDGDTITAALFNNEYNQLVNAFSNTSGHKHDGTTAEGPVIGLIGDAGETSPNNKVLIDTTNNYIEFYVEVSSAPVQQLYIADGAIIPVTDSDIDLGTTSLRFKDTYTDTVTTTGNVSIGGDLTVTGSATISGNLTFGDADTDSINLAAEIDSDIIPNTDGTYDLGSATKEWQDLYIDGTANIDSLVADTADINGGTIDGATIATSDITVGAGKTLNVSAGTLTLADNQISGDKVEGGTIAATTVTTLTSTTGNITNVNATTVDSTNLEVTNLKAKDGTAAGSIANTTGVVTLASSVLTTTDINGGTIDGVTIGGTTAGAVTFTDLSDGTITIAGFADEDNMVSNSATLLPTQQSVKAYVDAQVTAQDLDFQGDTGGALSIDLDSESLTIAGGTGLDTVGSGNTVTVNIDSTVATLTGTQTLTNKTLTSPDVNTPDIDGGTIDSTVIGGATPAAGTFTTLTANTSITGTLATAAQPNITSVGTLTGLTTTGDINFGDNDKAVFGAGSDLQIYHDGSHSYVSDQGTGQLRILASQFQVMNAAGTESMVFAAQDNTATLYYDNAAKLATTSSGIDITGTATMDGLTVDGTATINGTTPLLYLTESDTTDLNSRIRNTAGNLQIHTANDAQNSFIARVNISHSTGDISFYEDTGTTAQMTWDASADALTFTDNTKAIFGAGSDLEIYHDGSNSYIEDAGTGDLIVKGANIEITTGAGNKYFRGAANVARLYHTNNEKLATTLSGINVTGTAVTDGLTVDGDTVLDNGTIKLDGNHPDELQNVALGNTALDSLTTGGNYNVAIGHQALTANTSGERNVAVGRTALPANTTGDSNIAIGMDALKVSTTGQFNVAIGTASLDASTTASNNTAVGYASLGANTTGANNVALGYQALFSNTDISNLTAVGYGAAFANTTGASITAIGYRSLIANTSGSSNTALGRDTLAANTTGSNNTAIGSDSLENATTASNNTALGYQAMASITTGNNNVAIGKDAMDANTTADRNVAVGMAALGAFDTSGDTYNTAIGYAAAQSMTTGTANTIIGGLSGDAITTGSSNTSLGYLSLSGCTTADDNTAIGAAALNVSTTGASNTAVGHHALKANTTASNNTAVGDNSMAVNTTGTQNTAVGVSSLDANTTGDYNVALGVNALGANTTASNNTAIGRGALLANTTASNNTAVGDSALLANTTGTRNTALGKIALTGTTTGNYNIGLGYSAGAGLTTGSGNLAIGDSALAYATTSSGNTCVGSFDGSTLPAGFNTTGSLNTFIGQSAGNAVTTGSGNTIIGRYTGNAGGLDIRTSSNNIVLSDGDGNPRGIFDSSGNFLVGTTSATGGRIITKGLADGSIYTIVSDQSLFGSSTIGHIQFKNSNGGVGSIQTSGSATLYNTSSDYRLKENVDYNFNALDRVAQLKPARFNFIADADKTVDGFLAHEVQDIVPEAITGEKDAVDSEGNPEYQGIDQSKLVPLLTKAIQEQQTIIDDLKSRIETLEG